MNALAAIDTSAARPGIRAIVVVPARNEEALIGSCVRALGRQRGIAPAHWQMLLVLDSCTDATQKVAVEAAAGLGIDLETIVVDGLGAGGARAAGMNLACARFERWGRPDGLIATTDADSQVAPDWLAQQLEASAAGAAAIGGRISLEASSSRLLGAETLRRRDADHATRLTSLMTDGPTQHPFFGGASIALTARTYREIGGMEPLADLEDEALAHRLRCNGVEIHRLDAVRVSTSARTQGRAGHGLARDLRVSEWTDRRSWDGASFSVDVLLAAKRGAISLILPAREVGGTIARTIDEVEPLLCAGLLDEVIVVDAASEDGTAQVARGRGATVLDESELLPEFGPCRGKGDAMWRGVSAARGDLIVFCDADSANFHRGFVLGLLGPILTQPGVRLVKGAFDRPLRLTDRDLPDEGGRVTELVARPLLNLHFYELAGLDQPLAGEIAIDRSLFEQLHVPVGYGVEIAMLIDCLRIAGLDAIAQSSLGTRHNRHQPLRALGQMSYEVLVAATSRVDGARPPSPGPLLVPGATRQKLSPRCEERPPLTSLGAGERALVGSALAQGPANVKS